MPSTLAQEADSGEIWTPRSLLRLDWTLVAVLSLAFALRIAALVALPGYGYPDEIYQSFEPAHRLAFGYGIKAWEFEYGLRSMLVPYVFAGVFIASERIFGGPQGYVLATRMLLAVLSLLPVAAVYRSGLRISRSHAVILGLVTATWFEIIYFSFRPLSEALATIFLVTALAYLSPLGRAGLSSRRLAIVGALLGTAVMLRIQLSPAIVFALCYVCRLKFRARWAPVLTGTVPVVALFGVVDWITWGSPFYSFVQYIRVNAIEGTASSYGVTPSYWYLSTIVQSWRYAFPILPPLLVAGVGRAKLWAGVAFCILLCHSLIPHKEYRFVFPAVACLVIVAAYGTAYLVESLASPSPKVRWTVVIMSCAGWIAVSSALVAVQSFRTIWLWGDEHVRASYRVAELPNVCGILIYGEPWYLSGGYTSLHKNVPLYSAALNRMPAQNATEAFNVILLRRSLERLFEKNYRQLACEGSGKGDDLCILERSGGCLSRTGFVPLLGQHGLGAVTIPPGIASFR